MNDIIRSSDNRSLAERVKSALAERQQQSAHTRALLLDVSGSMDSPAADGGSRISALRRLAREFMGARRFVFSDSTRELAPNQEVGYTEGGTAMDRAFTYLRGAGVTHAVIITDGHPDDEQAALQAAVGLRLDIFYVGPPPPPQFLADLAARTGGRFGVSELTGGGARLLTEQVRARLLLPGR